MQISPLIGLTLSGLLLTLPVSAAPVPLQNATATFSQTASGDFSVTNTLSNPTSSSWAIFGNGAGNTAAQTAAFETQTDLTVTDTVMLTFTIAHTHAGGLPTRPNVGRFRLSYTTDDRSEFADGLKTGGDVTANWIVLDPVSFDSNNGETAAQQADKSLLVSGAAIENSIYTVKAPLDVSGITGFRIEAMEDPSLPTGGPGRWSNGNFHMSFFDINVEPFPNPLLAAQEAYLKASNAEASDQFGSSVAVSGNTVVVGAPVEDSAATTINGDQADNNLTGSGAAYVFVVDANGDWHQQAYLKASNAGLNDSFGYSVAIDGDRIVVGSWRVAGLTGAAYVFVRSGDTWAEEDILTAAEPGGFDFFAGAVDISGDLIVVGAHQEDSIATGIDGDQTDDTATDSGAAYIFARTGPVWSQQAYLKGSATEAGDHFGYSVAIDGNTVVVGSLLESGGTSGVNGNEADNTKIGAGAAYVFTHDLSNVWTQQAYLKASNTDADDQFGVGVAIDSDSLIVTANREDSSATGVNGDESSNGADQSGAGYIFVRDGGGIWSQQAYLKGPNTQDFQGIQSVAISGDTALIGAFFYDIAGAGYLFQRDSGGNWIEGPLLRGPDSLASSQFARTVGLSGNLAIAGMHTDPSSSTGINGDPRGSGASNVGSAFIFDLDHDPGFSVESPPATDLTTSKSLLDFGTGLIGTVSSTQTLTVVNTSGLTLTGLSVTVHGDAAPDILMDTSSLGTSLPPGGSGTIDLRMCYSVEGVRWATIRISTNNALDDPFIVSLAGTAATVETLALQAYAKASNPGVIDYFGTSVAIDGNTMVVGAYRESSAATGVNGDETDNSASAAGAAYVFVRDGSGIWSQQAYLKASNAGTDDWFGTSVAISGDSIVVGAFQEDSAATGVDGLQSDNTSSASGAAYVFVRDGGGVWSQQAYLKASNTGSGDWFGRAVAISGDLLVVGAYNEDSNSTGVNNDDVNNSASSSGAAYIFARDGGGVWTQQAYLKASNTESNDRFGWSVAISGDTAVISSWDEDSNATGVDGDETDNNAIDSGAAYAFVTDGLGNWSQQAYLKASNTESHDDFGTSVAIDGDTILIGAPEEASAATGVNGDQNDNSAAGTGAAYLFTRDALDTWTQQAYLKASNAEADDKFGYSVSLSGNLAAIGAHEEDSNAGVVNGDESNNSTTAAGASYVFLRNDILWTQLAYLKAAGFGASESRLDEFGQSVSISGTTIAVGAPGEDSNATGINGDQSNDSLGSSGAAYAFDLHLLLPIGPIAITATSFADNTFTIWFTADPAIPNWIFSGFEDLNGIAEAKNCHTLLQELSPGFYQADVDVSGEPTPYFLQISR